MKCGCSSSGRAPPCQGGGSEFEPRHPLQKKELAYAGSFAFNTGKELIVKRAKVENKIAVMIDFTREL